MVHFKFQQNRKDPKKKNRKYFMKIANVMCRNNIMIIQDLKTYREVDTIGITEIAQLVLPPGRMAFHLINSRRNTSNLEQIPQLLGREIAYTYSPCLA